MSIRSRGAPRGLIVAVLFAAAFSLGGPLPVRAASPAAPAAATLLAEDSITWKEVWSHILGFIQNTFRSRSRLIQISAVAVAFGLFIMFKCRRT